MKISDLSLILETGFQSQLLVNISGLSVGLKTEKEASDLISLCRHLKLKSLGSLAAPVSGMILGPVTSAFEEVDPPAAITVSRISNFMHSPKLAR